MMNLMRNKFLDYVIIGKHILLAYECLMYCPKIVSMPDSSLTIQLVASYNRCVTLTGSVTYKVGAT